MKLSADTAVISREKLHDYVLSPTHPDGRSKAAYLGEMGYHQNEWRVLERDLREQHLSHESQPGKDSPYGTKYEIVAPLTGPNGESRWLRTIWIVRRGEENARLITVIPEKRQ